MGLGGEGQVKADGFSLGSYNGYQSHIKGLCCPFCVAVPCGDSTSGDVKDIKDEAARSFVPSIAVHEVSPPPSRFLPSFHNHRHCTSS